MLTPPGCLCEALGGLVWEAEGCEGGRGGAGGVGRGSGGRDLPHRGILHKGGAPVLHKGAGKTGWIRPKGTGLRGRQYGCLFRKRENMVRAAWGLSVGTMCPAP